MEEKAKKLLAAVKKDDLAAFKKLCDKETEKYSFGRFPLLSLCYLYGSGKIAFAYEKKLLTLSRYTTVEEDRESYYLFRQKARRVLRLYVGDEKTISPLVMLAVLGRHDSLKALYPSAYKDDAVRREISYAEETLYDSPVEYGKNKIRIRRQKMGGREKATVFAACAMAMVMIACALIGYFFMPNDQGTEDAPVVISNGKQLELALKNEGFYSLAGDVETPAESIGEFKGTLNGNGHKVKLTGNAGAVLGKTEGTIKNVEFVVDVGEKEVADSTAFFISENVGLLENVTFSIKGKIVVKSKETEEENKETLYVSAFCGKNSGTISGCKINCDLTAENTDGRNAYLSALVSENSGTVTQCETSGSITSDTTDLAGIASENEKEGTITNSESALTLSQSSGREGWSPNVAGVCLHNYGAVSDCSFTGSASANCKVDAEDTSQKQQEIVYLGGIACINEGTMENCAFGGEISGKTQGASVYLGGIVSFNTNDVVGCVSSGKIETKAKEARSFIGGIAGINFYGDDDKSYRFGKVENAVSSVEIKSSSEDANDVNVGGLVGVNYCGIVTGGETSARIECNAGRFYLGGAVGLQDTLYFSSHLGVFGVKSTASIVALGETEQENYIGGVAGVTTVGLSGCEFDGVLKGKDNVCVGGIAGMGRYSIEGCSATSTIEVNNKSYVGGIMGAGNGRVLNCESSLTATVKEECLVGGTVAVSSYQSGASITDCTAILMVEAGKKVTAGGIAGKSSVSIGGCRAEGTLSAGDESIAGGLVGSNTGGVVKASYTSVRISTGNASVLGGITGSNEQGKAGYCFSACELTAGEGSFVGGTIGSADGAPVKYTYTFKDTNRESATQYCIRIYGDESKVEEVLEQSLSNNAYYYKNSYVGTDFRAFGEIKDYDDAPEEVFDLQATAYSTEEEMKRSDAYKEVYEDEAE